MGYKDFGTRKRENEMGYRELEFCDVGYIDCSVPKYWLHSLERLPDGWIENLFWD